MSPKQILRGEVHSQPLLGTWIYRSKYQIISLELMPHCNLRSVSEWNDFNPVERQRNSKLDDEFDLTIIHTNDVHAHFLESDARGSPCKEPGNCYGGVARRVTAINQIREDTEHENILILDAGDQSQGTWVHKLCSIKFGSFHNSLPVG